MASSDSKSERSQQSGTTSSDCLSTAEPRTMSAELLEIYSENVLAKLLRVAEEALENNVGFQGSRDHLDAADM